jgi:S-adenosylmethionine hydrolase
MGAAAANAAAPSIALLTDFGYRDHYAGVMRGVIASIAPDARVIDITHGIPPQSVIAAALALRESWRFFPPATIFVAVVDPGVGTARRPIAIATRSGARFVGPDNGLLWLATDQASIERIVELRSPRYRLAPVSASFHGRDIFAPAAAHLARGIALDELGPRLDAIERLDLGEIIEDGATINGAIIYVDGFGNLISNIDRARAWRLATSFAGAALWITIADSAPIPIRETYGDARKGDPLAMFGSFDLLEVAVREGTAAEYFRAGPGARVTLTAGATAIQR